MQLEISLKADPGGRWTGRDLGHLLHKHPDRVFSREIPCGTATVFFPERGDDVSRAVLHVETDPVGSVRGAGAGRSDLLKTYVNDRPFAASSFLSLAVSKSFAQTMAGRCALRPDLVEMPMPLEARIVPLWAPEGAPERFFAPLGYDVSSEEGPSAGGRRLHDLVLRGTARLSDLLRHLHVLVPALDGWKHAYLDESEIDAVLAKGEGWLADHPAREEILERSFGRIRSLRRSASDRFRQAEEPSSRTPGVHEERIATVAKTILSLGASSVLDLGCGEGRLLSRLVAEPGVRRLLGVEISGRSVAKARTRVGLDDAAPGLAERVDVVLGSILYEDDRFSGFDAAALVEVLEHVDPDRLGQLERVVFGSASPRHVVATTPNAEYNALFEGRLHPGGMRHADHRFEWNRAQFAAWCSRIGSDYGYDWRVEPVGPEDPVAGPLTQMAVFGRK